MGFFDSIFKVSAPLAQLPEFDNECAATVALLYSAVNSDGNVDELEIDALAKALALKNSFKPYNTVAYYEAAAKLSMKFGAAMVIKTAADRLSIPSKMQAFVLAIDLLLSNGNVSKDESQFIDDIATVMQLDQQWAKNAVETIYLKYS